jgi:hypothetical protein
MKEPELGHLQILDGHPVPYSLTTRIAGESVDAEPYRQAVEAWLAWARPGQKIERIEGAYVFYSA